jgi:hypothetical protein
MTSKRKEEMEKKNFGWLKREKLHLVRKRRLLSFTRRNTFLRKTVKESGRKANILC